MNDLAVIPLTMGMFAIVDIEDYEWLRVYNWKYDPDGYAMRNALAGEKAVGKRRNIRMQPWLMTRLHCNTLGRSPDLTFQTQQE